MTTFSPESRAVLKTSMGDITFAFLVDKAPRTCEHFVKLARQGFYDGLTFHRVLKDFMIQGGCPRGDGSGGPGFTLRAEFNDTVHERGVVSMARGTDPHSAGSQFFIVQDDARYLDSRYTAFAKVVDGLDVVDKIAAVPVGENRYRELSTPRDPIFINRIVLEGVEFDANDLPTTPPAGAPTPQSASGAGPTPATAPAPEGSASRDEGDESDDEDEGGGGDGDGDADGDGQGDRGGDEAGSGVNPAQAEGHGDGDAEQTPSASDADTESESGPARRGGGAAKEGGGGRSGGGSAARRRRGRRGRRSGGGGGGGGGAAGGGG